MERKVYTSKHTVIFLPPAGLSAEGTVGGGELLTLGITTTGVSVVQLGLVQVRSQGAATGGWLVGEDLEARALVACCGPGRAGLWGSASSWARTTGGAATAASVRPTDIRCDG